MHRTSLKSLGLLALLFFTAIGLTQDRSDFARTTYFGIQDSQMPEDPREWHGGRDLWVVRKGATPCFPGQRSFVGGSMGDISVVLRGRESDEASASLYSTVHGAGRVMSRTQAAGQRRWKNGKSTANTEGQISRAIML